VRPDRRHGAIYRADASIWGVPCHHRFDEHTVHLRVSRSMMTWSLSISLYSA
jgi:hypothetical protein